MHCPICKRELDDAAQSRKSGFYPFCSERCKLIDLGRWLDGRYQIPLSPEEEVDSTPPSVANQNDDDEL